METFLIAGVVILAILAVMDLVVGVGNDAVNFLNSAIGSKVATFRTIMWVATAGIFIGALSSAGMMEIAREGIFNPQYFNLENVMIIFLAVMLTDILLLDTFNTLGLPTSTTVSIIFELLGASIIVSTFMILSAQQPMNYLFNINDAAKGIIGYINWSKTSTIISSILLSVLLSFTFGAVVMWLSRVLFSFDYRKKLKFTGVIWGSLAMLALSYFLVYKGLKSTYSTEELTSTELISYIKSVDTNAPNKLPSGNVTIKDISGQDMVFELVSGEGTENATYEIFFGSKDIKSIVNYIKANMIWFLILFFVFWLVVFSVLHQRGYNPLKIVVFAGTFSLAMAFAGNDLVNFIGVPLAGIQSYQLFNAANISAGGVLSPDTYLMNGLQFPIQTPYIYLIIAGLVMVLTLWFSKKAKNVTETEVKLGTQEETEEKFSSNLISRKIVHGSMAVGRGLQTILPLRVQNKINEQFIPILYKEEGEAPAFDIIRASVNLTIASMLIALGTSYKLPLSTTYVTFMVAMGTSLADRAWGRESASYRIAGVINVIGGWFLTALVAFSSAAIMALILLSFKLPGLIFVCSIVILSILYTTYKNNKAQARKLFAEDTIQIIDFNTDKAMIKTSKKLGESLYKISESFNNAIDGLLNENQIKIDRALTQKQELFHFYSDIKNNLFKAIKKSKLDEKKTAQLYILSNDLMQDILQSLGYIIQAVDNHVKNAHKPLTADQTDILRKIQIDVTTYLNTLALALDKNEYDDLFDLKSNKRLIFDHIEDALSLQVEGISKKEYGFKNSDLFLNLLLETKDLVAISLRFNKLLHRLVQNESPLGNR